MSQSARNTKRELKATCTLGFLNLNTGNSKSFLGYTGFIPQPSDQDKDRFPDYNNALNQQEKSKTLRKIAAGGGVIAQVNDNIGAPNDTFCMGSIAIGQPHPILTLVSGPTSGYNFNYVSTKVYSQTNIQVVPPTYKKISEVVLAVKQLFNVPRIPDREDGYLTTVSAGTLKVNTTWNIWILYLFDSNNNPYSSSANIQLFYGYLPNSVNPYEPTMYTSIDGNQGAVLQINSKSGACRVVRLFPIAQDLVYGDANGNAVLWHARLDNPTQIYSKPIYAKGYYNCGFRISVTVSGIEIDQEQGVNSNPYIIISWGDDTNLANYLNNPRTSTSSLPNVYQNYAIICYQGQDAALYLDGNKAMDLGFRLDKAQTYNFYVHYAGLQMYVGTKPDPSTWHANSGEELITDGSNVTTRIYHSMTNNAGIFVEFNSIEAQMQYGPICFNNEDPDGYFYTNTTDSTGKNIVLKANSPVVQPTDANPSGYPFYKVGFTITGPVIDGNVTPDEDTLNRSSETYINDELLSNGVYCPQVPYRSITGLNNYRIFPPHPYTDPVNDPTAANELLHAGSFYYDYRLATIPFYYQEISRTPITTNIYGQSLPPALNGDIQINGYVYYLSTIEGPPLFRVSSTKNDVFQNNDRPSSALIQSITGGDISEFFESATITSSLKNKFHNRLEKTATIVLKNLHTSQRGASILYLIKNNIITFTVKAGYANNNNGLYTFFEGVIDANNVRESASSSTITVTCKDVLSTLITSPTGMYFPNAMQFKGMRYSKVLTSVFESVGLDPYLWINIGDSAVLKASNFRFGYIVGEPYNSSQGALIADKRTYVGEIIDKTLNLIVADSSMGKSLSDTSANLAPNATQINIPVLFWDTSQDNGVISIQQRGDIDIEEKQTSSNLEVLKFVAGVGGTGLPDTLPNFDINNFDQLADDPTDPAPGIHGLLSGDFEVKSSNNLLSAAARFVGQKADSTLFMIKYLNPSAIDSTYLSNINLNSPNVGITTFKGYVGYKKLFIADSKDTAALDPRLLTSPDILNNIARYLFNQVTNVLESIDFTVLVVKPLLDYGKFKIQLFTTEADNTPFLTDEFFYENVVYTINKNSSVITAQVSGQNLSFVAGLGKGITDEDLESGVVG